MEKYSVLINNEASTNGGNIVSLETRSQALNIAMALARAFYNFGVEESHIFVLKYDKSVIYHYEALFKNNIKSLILYERYDRNRKVIARQVIK